MRIPSNNTFHYFLSIKCTDDKLLKIYKLTQIPDRRTIDRRFQNLPIVTIISTMGNLFVSEKLVDDTYASVDSSMLKTAGPVSLTATPTILGHVAITVQDSDGQIKHYVESDNAIVDSGENCIGKLLFNNKTSTGIDQVGTTACVGSITQPFSVIGLGIGAATDQQTDLVTPITGNGFDLQYGTTSWTNATGGNANIVVLERQYIATGSVNGIQETGLFNGTDVDTNAMFARNVFTAVDVVADDTLTIRWTITIN